MIGESLMDIGAAVKERILELCKQRNITINKLTDFVFEYGKRN